MIRIIFVTLKKTNIIKFCISIIFAIDSDRSFKLLVVVVVLIVQMDFFYICHCMLICMLFKKNQNFEASCQEEMFKEECKNYIFLPLLEVICTS